MIVYLVRRAGQSVLAVVAMAVLVFLGVYAIGNPVDVLINPEATQAQIAATTQRLGLDKPLWQQFGIFLGNAIHGDLGTSFVYGRPALDIILERLPATMELAVVALILSVGLGVPLGVWAGLRPHGLAGKTIMGGSILGFSLPNFWQGMLLILVFAVLLGWLPAGGRGQTTEFMGLEVSFLTLDGLSHLILPAINLALFKMSLIIRLARANTREVCLQDYVKFARAKGLSGRRVVMVHVLKNIMIPVVTIIGLELGSMVAFAIVTETVFAWPGMGKLLIDSINLLDRPVIVAYLMLTVLIIVTINFLVDVIYSLLDPRIRLSEMKG
ncbi:ABC transporter permease [Jannaschia rubra]|uniref:Dipeptide transport system permease protein DppB n=1 Tax=Jannaschia rubra TaxID=282197 RepID=A0A0M6XQ74_9RHOB|nr:ABC transporter permease [Jannaschia rubra]CTQ32747.1 Dipeptide transport system permease protein DppB [Jannaschia rubra]SFF88758.1 peptide/nickel transport system permease protein [Jannaschia rubra]